MENIKNILVSLDIEGHVHEIGELVLNNKTIYFRYKTDFLNSGLNISPIKLPFNNEINSADPVPFEWLLWFRGKFGKVLRCKWFFCCRGGWLRSWGSRGDHVLGLR